MKYTIMKCPICSKEFYSEYWKGGYIDHVTNLVGNLTRWFTEKPIMENTQENIDRLADLIYSDGNDIREKEDIKCRLNCFLKADFIPTEIKQAVEKRVRSKIGRKENATKKLIDGVETLLKTFTDEEIKWLCKAVEEKQYGTYSPVLDKLESVVHEECKKRRC